MPIPFQQPAGPAPDRFWKNVERELGTPVRSYALGQYLSGTETPGPLWGLVYLTDDVLYFRHFAQFSWWSSLMPGATDGGFGDDEAGRSDRPAREQNIVLQIPIGWIRAVLPPEERRGLTRLFRGEDRIFQLTMVDPGRDPFTFSLESHLDEFAAALTDVVDRHRRSS